MPKVHVNHVTEYNYAAPVRFTPHRLMLRPHDSHDLRLINTTLTVSPPGAAMTWSHDVFSNSVCTLDWEGAQSDTLHIISELDLEHYPGGPALPHETLAPWAETYPFSYSAQEFPDLARLMERHDRDHDHLVDRWARRFLKSGGPTRTMDLLVGMTQAVKADFRYVTREAEGTNAPAATLTSGTGACRDLALLMMEAVRSLGFAARFVSGYLYDEDLVDSADAMVGGGATHAWCMVYLPGAGWVEFDPTNGLIAGRNLIRVCVARTPDQAIPVAGGFIGRRGDFINMNVNVMVTVGDPPLPLPVPPQAPRSEREAGSQSAMERAPEAERIPGLDDRKWSATKV